MDVNQTAGGGNPAAAAKTGSVAVAVTDSSKPDNADSSQIVRNLGLSTAYTLDPLHSAETDGGEKKQQSSKNIVDVTNEMNTFMESLNTDIRFKLHYKTNELMVEVVDSKNDRVLKECPPHEFLDRIARIKELVGTFLNKEV